MFIANKSQIEKFTGKVAYPSGKFHDDAAAKVNAAIGAKLPCYAIPGKRVAFKWVSVGSSAVISRGVAASMLRAVGVDIEQVEAAR